MKEFKNIVKEYDRINLKEREVALATVVKVRGSSYRSPGARMLICDDGKWVGSISGGCLEGDALRKARQVMQSKIPVTVTYDTREESNQNLGIGLGCNGVIDVFIEPIDANLSDNPIIRFKDFINNKEAVALASIYYSNDKGLSSAGEKLLLQLDGTISGNFQDKALQESVKADLIKLFDHGLSASRKYETSEGVYEVFTELIQPTVSLMIFGGGFDARPVSALGKTLGWDVTVTDECVAHIAPIFFPTADKISLCQRAYIDKDFDITKYSACVLMSHNYEYDRDVLRKLIKTETPYIGILGPRKRFDKMLEEFVTEGFKVTETDIERIHSPIGLDVGAETPDEIALSIISEIQAVFTNRSGGFLKSRLGPIHTRDQHSDQVYKQVYLQKETMNN